MPETVIRTETVEGHTLQVTDRGRVRIVAPGASFSRAHAWAIIHTAGTLKLPPNVVAAAKREAVAEFVGKHGKL